MFSVHRSSIVVAALFAALLSGCAQPVDADDEGATTVTSAALVRVSPYASAAFVDGLFVDLLDRPASAAERSMFVGQLRSAVVDAVLVSTEYRGRRIGELYGELLGREPSRTELANFLGLNASLETIAHSILVSSERYDLDGRTGAGFVGGLYTDLLGRPAGASEIAVLAGTARPELVTSVQGSSEARTRIIGQVYASLHVAAPSNPSTLLTSWSGELALVAVVAKSTEYASRF